MNSTVTDLKLQRWVDGQVTRDEEQELLADCDSHPGQWRRVALAFIEERAMSREFAAEFGVEVRSTPKPTAKATESKPATSNSASWLASRQVQQWCAIAATLLLGLFVGNSFNWEWPTRNPTLVQKLPVGPTGPTELVSSPMVDYIPEHSRGERYRMPLLDERSAPEHYFDKEVELTGLPPEFARMLKEHGIELRGLRDFTSYELADGQLIMVPTIRFDLRQAAPHQP
jgi:hypothetical protein